jgi:hypothetical protein
MKLGYCITLVIQYELYYKKFFQGMPQFQCYVYFSHIYLLLNNKAANSYVKNYIAATMFLPALLLSIKIRLECFDQYK